MKDWTLKFHVTANTDAQAKTATLNLVIETRENQTRLEGLEVVLMESLADGIKSLVESLRAEGYSV